MFNSKDIALALIQEFVDAHDEEDRMYHPDSCKLWDSLADAGRRDASNATLDDVVTTLIREFDGDADEIAKGLARVVKMMVD